RRGLRTGGGNDRGPFRYREEAVPVAAVLQPGCRQEPGNPGAQVVHRGMLDDQRDEALARAAGMLEQGKGSAGSEPPAAAGAGVQVLWQAECIQPEPGMCLGLCPIVEPA